MGAAHDLKGRLVPGAARARSENHLLRGRLAP
jgi:hypothetical protein